MSRQKELRDYLELRQQPDRKILFHPILMQFAAHLNGATYTEFMTDYKVLVESNIKCLERFDLDSVGLISDPYRETAAFGAKPEFYGNKSPYCAPIVRTREDVGRLKNPNVHHCERTADRIKAAGYYRRLLGDGIPVIGWIEGPLAEAADLSGVNQIMVQLLMDEDFVRSLMDVCMTTAKDFARAQVESGCLVIGIGDAVCSQIDGDTYQRMVMPLHAELTDYIHSLGAFVKMHICGDISHLLPYLAQTRIDILDLDWMVDLDAAREAVETGTILCGNLNPVDSIQELSTAELEQEAVLLLEKEKNNRFIFSGGCEITPETPPENLKLLAELRYKIF